MEEEKKPKTIDKLKHILLTGESLANEKRKAELRPKIEMADKTFRVGLLFFFLLFWIIVIWRYFV